MAATGRIGIPVSRTHPLCQVRAAFTRLELHHPLGKVVLLPGDTGPHPHGEAGADALPAP